MQVKTALVCPGLKMHRLIEVWQANAGLNMHTDIRTYTEINEAELLKIGLRKWNDFR